MKKLIPLFSAVVLMAACNTAPPASENSAAQVAQVMPSSQADTTGLAQYQNWKAQNELASVAQYNQPQQKAAVTPAVKIVRVPVAAHKTAVKKPAASTGSSSASSSSSNNDVATTTGSGNSESAGEAKAAQKKGISKAAKGAVIGGVVGAAGGAIINKDNRVLGAVIGGVIGAGGGYAIGRGMDKKDGRIQYTPSYAPTYK